MRSIALVAAGAVSATLLWHAFGGASAANSDTYKQLNLFGDVFDRVRTDYVEVPEDEMLIENAINGMLAGLDPHSSYMNAKRFQEMQVQTRGEFGGLGIEVTMENGIVKVISPIDDTPATKAGILAGDLIVEIDGQQVQGLTLEQAVDKMRGKVNTSITLTIVREGKAEPFEIKLIRDLIRLRAVKFELEGNDVGYIRISSFSEQTQEGLDAAIADLKAKAGSNLKGYILDLRNNPGGLLDQAISVSDTFLERGEIVSTRGRNPGESQRRIAEAGDVATGKKVVVLINGGSASASEIVAGALQDHKRATIMGTRTFGKASVQTIIPIGSQGALRLTTARYYTPSGRSIQAKGIDPDLLVEQDVPDDQKSTTARSTGGEASLRGHLKNESDEQEGGGSSAYVPKEKEKDKQLLAALDLLRGKPVDQYVSKPKVEAQSTPKASLPNADPGSSSN
ncbi:MAG TPA: S41 family peptidase [Aestuariivirgaceae bacterium]